MSARFIQPSPRSRTRRRETGDDKPLHPMYLYSGGLLWDGSRLAGLDAGFVDRKP